MSILRIASLPAREGDCLVMSYGPAEDDLRHVVVDAGHSETASILVDYLESIGAKRLRLVVVTHVDADHIEGMVDFLRIVRGRLPIDDVWFNGWRHLDEELEGFGPVQGESLTTLLEGMPWNRATAGRAVRLADDDEPRVIAELEGLRLTALSPDSRKLKSMVGTWEKAVRAAGLVPGDGKSELAPPPGLEALGSDDINAIAAARTGRDTAKANGTSIALLAEYDGRRILLGADAHPNVLTRSLQKLEGGAKVHLDLLKVPHHGSQANVTTDLLGAVDCHSFLISTDGTKFNHPDPVAVARIVVSQAEPVRLLFNYRQPRTQAWADRAEAGSRYHCVFPPEDGPLVVTL